MSNFPPLRAAVLQGLVSIRERLDGDPEYLNSPDCPYDQETKDVLTKLLAKQVVEVIVEKEAAPQPVKRAVGRPSKDIELEADEKKLIVDGIKELIEGLDAMGTGQGLATNERIQITKTKSNLIEQLLKMRERNTSAQRVEEFKNQVIQLLADLGSEKDKEIYIARIAELRHI